VISLFTLRAARASAPRLATSSMTLASPRILVALDVIIMRTMFIASISTARASPAVSKIGMFFLPFLPFEDTVFGSLSRSLLQLR
jgi:hypothetical protein